MVFNPLFPSLWGIVRGRRWDSHSQGRGDIEVHCTLKTEEWVRDPAPTPAPRDEDPRPGESWTFSALVKVVAPRRGHLVSSLGLSSRRHLSAGWQRGQTRRNRRALTSELSKTELAQSVAGVGVIVQHDKDGKLPIVHLSAPHHPEVGQWQRRELIHGHEDIASHFSDPL